LEEYKDSEEVEVACDCLKELNSDMALVETVRKAVQMGLEGTDRERNILMKLLKEFNDTYKVFSTVNFEDGFSEILKSIEEYSLDSPLVYSHMGRFMSFMITNYLLTFATVNNLLTPFIESGEAAKVIIETLTAIYKEKGLETAQSWATNIKAESFITPQFLNDTYFKKAMNTTPSLRSIFS